MPSSQVVTQRNLATRSNCGELLRALSTKCLTRKRSHTSRVNYLGNGENDRDEFTMDNPQPSPKVSTTIQVLIDGCSSSTKCPWVEEEILATKLPDSIPMESPRASRGFILLGKERT
jgi:hypothetical protein